MVPANAIAIETKQFHVLTFVSDFQDTYQLYSQFLLTVFTKSMPRRSNRAMNCASAGAASVKKRRESLTETQDNSTTLDAPLDTSTSLDAHVDPSTSLDASLDPSTSLDGSIDPHL